jgi:hypothetical protein
MNLKERNEDNSSTHPDLDPDLWFEVRLSGRPDRNWVYGLSNTTTENLQIAHSVLTIGCSQSVPSTQTLSSVASILYFLYLNVQMFKFVINIYNILF